MEDSKNNTLQPVISPSESWHLATAQAYQLAAKMASEIKPKEGIPIMDEVSRLAQAYVDEADSAWQAYLRQSDRAIDTCDRASTRVTYDENRALPLVEWPQDGSEAWGMVDVHSEDGDMVMATPFRVVDTRVLPKDKIILKLHDPHHAASAALVETMQCAMRDATGAFQVPDATMGWRRLCSILDIYRQAANIAMGRLADDDYIGWRPNLPSRYEIVNAASLLCQHAATARAQCALATFLMAAWVQAMADSIEGMDPEARRDEFLAQLKRATKCLQDSLNAQNNAVALTQWPANKPMRCMVIFRPLPQSIPVLVVMSPKGSVTKLPRKKKA